MTIDSYDPNIAPDPASWLALGDDERRTLVEAWHATLQAEMPNIPVHAMMHVIVENQVAEGDALPVQRKVRQLMAQGLDRHDAIHAVASVLMHHFHALMTRDETGKAAGSDQNQRYFSALGRLNARKWLRSG
ncbi:MAG: hypothetical protein P4L71_15040 [Acetobacteraceae bacterium]|nr:hypothetical protein [Acetobacteraceae bacterium]